MNKKTLLLLSGSLVVFGIAGYYGYKWWSNRSKNDFKYGAEVNSGEFILKSQPQNEDFWKSGELVKLTKNLPLTKYEANTNGSGLIITSNKDNLTTDITFQVVGYDNFADGKRYVVITPKNSTNTYYAISTSALKKP